jgi:RimJ/RimL family protein N-acetyltransferase
MNHYYTEGKLCKLRPMKASDVKVSVDWRNDPAIRDYIQGYRMPVTYEMEQQWLEGFLHNTNPNRVGFAISPLDSDKLLGMVFLNQINWFDRNAKLGIFMAPGEKRRKGFGTEACQLMVDYGYKTLNLHRITVEIVATNDASIRVFEKLNFTLEGTMKEVLFANGAYHDIIIMGLLNKNHQ